MEDLVKGNVVILLFPFSDLSSAKKRPAVIVAKLTGNDSILAQITSVERKDEYAINLTSKDFKQGSLPQESIIKPNKLFTADKSLIFHKAGTLKENKIKEVENALMTIFKQ
ncbi:type II toxin-antitoxin system PemK/MazF family toxin [Candidatus Woesearchaeota archaeon]|nr:type II toxin-antitoxin system PemK/MazF family toxin [Candidatus Woesearchaeota archaeon]